MTQTRREGLRSQPLIDPVRLPHGALRSAETTLKRRTFAVENAAVLRLQALYRAAYRDLRDALDAQPVHRVAGRALLVQIAVQRIERLKRAALDAIEASARAALVGGYYGRLWLLDMATQPDVRVNVPPLTEYTLDDGALREDLYDTLIRDLLGKGWRAQFEVELDDLVVGVRRALGGGLIDGEGMGDIARRVRDAMGVETDRRRGKAGSAERRGYRANFNRVQSLTRTVVQTVATQGALAAYRANTDILSGYEWLTTKDERACPDCRSRDGTVYAFKSRVRPPLHPNCRCTVIPVIKSGALDDTGGKAPRRSLRAWVQGYGMDTELAAFLAPRPA